MCRYWRSSLPLINSFSVIYKIILSVSKNAPAVGALFFCFIENTADHIGAFLFLGLIQMGIDICRCGQVGVPEKGRYIQQRHILIDEDAGEGVPLRYNYDKPEKPRISRIFGYLARFFILFQTEKSSREVVIS